MDNQLAFLFGHMLSKAEADTLVSHFKPEFSGKKAIIMQPPAICRRAYFICEGFVRQSYEKDGIERTAYLYLKHSFFTDLNSFQKQQPSRYSFHAVSDCHLLSITFENLEKLYTQGASFERWGRKVYESICLELIDTAERLLFLSPEERFDLLLQKNPHILQLLPQKHIAMILGVTPESFSRLKRRIQVKSKS